MKNLIDGKRLLIISIVICLYFLTLFVLDFYNITNVLIGAVAEIFTFPLLLAEIFFLILGIVLLFKQSDQKTFIVISVLALSLCTALTIGSFFLK
ncbi:MAG TPA: hypothetical protein VFM70_09685 [Salinimicrobium sp.]|nr:hypothetical protein [Salinimicrobium sp.]